MNGTSLEAIRAKCLDCPTHGRAEVQICRITDCPLYALLIGQKPNRCRSGAPTPKSAAEHKVPHFEVGLSAPGSMFQVPITNNETTPTGAAIGAKMEVASYA